MKICPQCRAEYEDDMSFCLQDGTTLIDSNVSPAESVGEETLALPKDFVPPTVARQDASSPAPTQVSPQVNQSSVPTAAKVPDQAFSTPQQFQSAAPQKSNSGIPIGLLLGGLLFVGAAIGGGFWLFQSRESADLALFDSNKHNQSNSTNENSDKNLDYSNIFPENSATNAKSNSNSSELKTSSNNALANKSPSPSPLKETENKPTPKPETFDEDDEPPPPPKTPPPVPKTISGGALNGKATRLVKPAYPPAARAVNASGAVNVQVTVDENGNVISASAVSGHPLLRASAVDAARQSKFSPTMLSGQAVKVTGVIVYNFVP